MAGGVDGPRGSQPRRAEEAEGRCAEPTRLGARLRGALGGGARGTPGPRAPRPGRPLLLWAAPRPARAPPGLLAAPRGSRRLLRPARELRLGRGPGAEASGATCRAPGSRGRAAGTCAWPVREAEPGPGSRVPVARQRVGDCGVGAEREAAGRGSGALFKNTLKPESRCAF